MTNLAAANHEDQLVANLPGEHERATALDFRELGHGKECMCVCRLVVKESICSRAVEYNCRLAIRKANPAGKLVAIGIAS
jgi:hypothetical protein